MWSSVVRVHPPALFMRQSLLRVIDQSTLEAIVKDCDSWRDTLEALGFRRNSGRMQTILKKVVSGFAISTTHFGNRYAAKLSNGTARYTLDEILIEHSGYESIQRLKIRLVRAGVIVYECERCKNQGMWQDEPLSLQLDHRNGEPSDHRRENLRFLCPNCHSQTETFSGRNKCNSFPS